MKYRFLISALLMSLFLGQANSADLVELDRVVAIINDEAISQTELQTEMRMVKMQLKQRSPTLPSDAILQKQVLERLIMKHLKQQLAKLNNIIIDDETLNRALSNIAEQNDMSLAKLRSILEKDGFDFSEYRETIRDEILHSRLRQRFVEPRISISENEVDQFISSHKKRGNSQEEYRLGHFLIGLPEGASPSDIKAAQKRGEAILKRLNNGEDFTQLAIAESDGQLALSGGDLGWRKLGEIPSLFANAVTAMKKGDTSQLIRSPSGFHIIKLNDIRGGKRHVVNQIHARHILIKTNALIDDKAAKKRLQNLKKRIENGADFAELARSHSDDTGTASKGGDLGWAGPGQMVPAFEKVMFNTKPNVISEPFQSKFGWHILEVLGTREFDDTEQMQRNMARQQLFERKAIEEEELWLRQLRDEAYVKILL